MKSNDMSDLLHGSIWRKVLIFALPLALTSVLQQLFSAADVAVLGTFVGKNSMAAVGSNAPVVGLMINLFVGISVGANVMMSRYTGANDADGVSRTAHTSVVLAVLSGITIAAVGNIIASPIVNILGVPADIAPLAIRYLRIYFCGMPFVMLYNFQSAIFRSQGDTRTPLICLAISGLVNVALNLFFVIVVGMDVEGVAIATVIADALSSSLLFYFLKKHSGAVRIFLNKLRIDKRITRNILRIGIPSGMQGMVFSISNLLIQSAINSLGTDAMAGTTAAFNIEIMAYFISNAFGQAAVTFVGQNHGASNYRRCKDVVKQTLILNWISMIAFGVSVIVFGKEMLSVFNDDMAVIKFGYIRLVILMAGEVLNSTIETLSGGMRGYGYSLSPAIVTLLGVCGFRIIWIYTFFKFNPTWFNLMLVYPVSWAVTSAMMVVAYKRTIKKVLPKGELLV
ncbi:MATE family efflux transporter [Mogibacterium neglectum]|uniref:MATE family efflux transporter n=1 Tax=Mogibacterium neglectum TaxID=114528 RepID=UPI002729FDC6|nr:MATE family efflux transporter [Mogibacterium neglectum]WLD76677.1 MATE family efflux transporter [Mogibacterium neglectum]